MSTSHKHLVARAVGTPSSKKDEQGQSDEGMKAVETISTIDEESKEAEEAEDDKDSQQDIMSPTNSSIHIHCRPHSSSAWLRLPNTSFGISMGLAGQAIMWRAAGSADFISDVIDTDAIATAIWITSLCVGVILITAYCAGIYVHRPHALCKAEYNDASRIHFFNMPHLITIMLTISVPPNEFPSLLVGGENEGRRAIWVIAFIVQLIFTQQVYEGWLFSETYTVSSARPQFLLSTVGWVLLAVLGAQVEIEDTWGLPLPKWCLGFGLMLYVIVANSIFNGLYNAPTIKGSPALFLLIAPPATAAMAIDLLDDDFTNFSFLSELLLGWCLGIFCLLIRIGPTIWESPPSLGSYWAYVFPLSALGTLLIRYAWVVDTISAQVVAVTFMVIAAMATTIVFLRTSIHIFGVYAGYIEWEDPLFSAECLASCARTRKRFQAPNEVETA